MNDPLALEADLTKPLPPVCLKCASTNEIVRRPESLGIVTPAARSMGLVGGLIGASVASMVRNDKELLVPLLAVIGVGVVVFAVYSQRTSRRVDVTLPLCASCDAAWSKAKAARPLFLGAFIVSAVLVLAGLATEAKPLLLVAGALFFGVCLYAVVTKPAARYVIATNAEGPRVTLSQVSSLAIERIATGDYPKKRKKKKAPVTDERETSSS